MAEERKLTLKNLNELYDISTAKSNRRGYPEVSSQRSES